MSKFGLLSSGTSFKGQRNEKAIKMYEKNHEVTSIGELTDYSVLNQYHVSSEGDMAPTPIEDWSSLSKEMQDSLQSMGYSQPTPIQKYSIPCYRNMRPLIAISPTGSGKTLAYAIPLLEKFQGVEKGDTQAIILVPSRELASQVFRQFRRFSETLKVSVQLLRKNRDYPKCTILIATPKRLLQFSEKISSIKYVILDEADYLLSHSFVAQTDQVLSKVDSSNIHVAIFSATMTQKVEDTARSFMQSPVKIQIGDEHVVSSLIKQELKFVGTEKGKIVEIIQRIQAGTLGLPLMIFVMNKQRAYDLAGELPIPCSVLTSEENDTERAESIKKLRTGESLILVATDLGGRGIDLPALQTVINFDLPPDSTTYIHRIGRTARAGRSGTAITFFTIDDQPNLRPVAIIMKKCGYEIEEYMLKPVDKKHRGARALFEPNQRKSISSKVWKNAKVRVPKPALDPST